MLSTRKITALVGATFLAVGLAGFSTTASATLIDMSDVTCNDGQQQNDIALADVTGDGDLNPTECAGTLDGNDPGPGGSIEIDGVVFEFLTKVEGGEGTEGADIGLTYDTENGTWSYDAGVTLDDPWLLVLKQANNPGFAVWVFSGASAAATSGTYFVAWHGDEGTLDLSHMAIYGGEGGDCCTTVPEPGPIGLLGGGMIALYFIRRRRFLS